jgi:hypothetical protein
MHLTGNYNYANRQVSESFGSTTIDQCYPLVPNSQWPPAGVPPSWGPWPVQSGNNYGQDYSAIEAAWFNYYSARIPTSCSTAATQQMWIQTCIGVTWTPYATTHPIGVTVYPSAKREAFRGGVTGSNQ